MPPALTLGSVPEDDAALHALLDALDGPDPAAAAGGSGSGSGGDGGGGGAAAGGAAGASTMLPTFTAREIPAALSAANAVLGAHGSADTLPALARDGGNAPAVLAAALTAVVRLARSAGANAALRRAAEARELDAAARAAKLERELQAAVLKLRARDGTVAGLEARVAEGAAREKAARRAAAAEIAALRAAVAKAGHRAAAQMQEARKREREFAKLQKRVHAQLKNARRVNTTPQVTLAEHYVAHTAVREEDGGETGRDGGYAQFVDCAYQQRIDELGAENEEFRALVRAVHGELDALMETFPQIGEVERAQQRLLDGDDAEFRPPMPAPPMQRMMLPYETVREEVEDALVAKFKMLRRALLDAEECGEDAPEDVLSTGEATVARDAREPAKENPMGEKPQVDQGGAAEKGPLDGAAEAPVQADREIEAVEAGAGEDTRREGEVESVDDNVCSALVEAVVSAASIAVEIGAGKAGKTVAAVEVVEEAEVQDGEDGYETHGGTTVAEGATEIVAEGAVTVVAAAEKADERHGESASATRGGAIEAETAGEIAVRETAQKQADENTDEGEQTAVEKLLDEPDVGEKE